MIFQISLSIKYGKIVTENSPNRVNHWFDLVVIVNSDHKIKHFIRTKTKLKIKLTCLIDSRTDFLSRYGAIPDWFFSANGH